MKHTLVFLALIIVVAISIPLVLANLEDSRTNRNYSEAARERARGEAQALIITAQGQARLDAAQAAAITNAAALPAMVLVAVFFGSMAFVSMAYMFYRASIATSPQKIIERHIIYMISPGQSNRETWQCVSSAARRAELGPGSE